MDKMSKLQNKLEVVCEKIKNWTPESDWDQANQRSLRVLEKWRNRLEKAIERLEQRDK